MESLGFDVDPATSVGALSVARRQMGEIAKVLTREAKIIVLDEPSAVLAQAKTDRLLGTVRQLSREDGVALVHIPRGLREVFETGDTATILRVGRVVADRPASAMTTDGMIPAMVGRE